MKIIDYAFHLTAAMVLLGLMFSEPLWSQPEVATNYRQNQTPTYKEVIEQYRNLAQLSDDALLIETGITDCGRPLHIFLCGYKLDPGASLSQLAQGKTVILINNGIHPGESAGIDASLIFAKDYLASGITRDLLVAIIPVYNVGGALNRGAYSRANQVGPAEHGFRGNARLLDLNRDFIKADALNTRSFYAVFHALQPHLFVDTHTSNGADYQYTITLISPQKDKLNPVLTQVLESDLEPYLYERMAQSPWEMIPYVNVFDRTPETGYSAFFDSPRYGTGYVALFNTIGFTTETHMLKPYADRVQATLQFLKILQQYASENGPKLRTSRQNAYAHDLETRSFGLRWSLDSSRFNTIDFRGYNYRYTPSRLGSYDRLQYLTDQPRDFQLDYYPHYQRVDSAEVPRYFLVPQAWREAVSLLQQNQVKMIPLNRDTILSVSMSYVTKAAFSDRPYEGHFPILDLTTEERESAVEFYPGDWLVPLDQPGRRFLMAVLEPRAVDSYLRWNFFDEIFQRKEYFSPYVFEDTAGKLLTRDEELRKAFELWQARNPELSSDSYQVLNFIYQRSPYYEKSHRMYPVARIF